MGKMQRNKGSAYEREVAAALFDELGLTFTRNLEQVRTGGEGDLVCEDQDFPFLIECKRRKGGAFDRAWMVQATHAADKAALLPAVLYRMDYGQTRCVVPLSAVYGTESHPVEMTLEAFCYLSRELMADDAEGWGGGNVELRGVVT